MSRENMAKESLQHVEAERDIYFKGKVEGGDGKTMTLYLIVIYCL